MLQQFFGANSARIVGLLAICLLNVFLFQFYYGGNQCPPPASHPHQLNHSTTIPPTGTFFPPTDHSTTTPTPFKTTPTTQHESTTSSNDATTSTPTSTPTSTTTNAVTENSKSLTPETIPALIISHRYFFLERLFSQLTISGLPRDHIFVFSMSPTPADSYLKETTKRWNVSFDNSFSGRVNDDTLLRFFQHSFRTSLAKFPNARTFLLLEDDIEIGKDFVSYFRQITPLLHNDTGLGCITGWYDNGFGGLVGGIDGKSNDILIRHDHFGGYGWATTRTIIEQFINAPASSQPWDLIFQQVLAGRPCIAPFVPRSRHYPTGAFSMHAGDSDLYEWLENIALSDQFETNFHAERNVLANYQKWIDDFVATATPVESLADILKYKNNSRLIGSFSSFQGGEWRQLLDNFHIIGLGMGGIQRGVTLGQLVLFRISNNFVFLGTGVKSRYKGSVSFSNFNPGLPSSLPSDISPPSELTVVKAAGSNSCMLTCGQQSPTQMCDVQLFPWIVWNMTKYSNCEGGISSDEGWAQPSVEGNKCFTSKPARWNCDKSGSDTRNRLCPCVPIPERFMKRQTRGRSNLLLNRKIEN